MTDMNITSGFTELWNQFDLFGVGNELLCYVLILIFVLAAGNMAMKHRMSLATGINAAMLISGMMTTGVITLVVLFGMIIWTIALYWSDE